MKAVKSVNPCEDRSIVERNWALAEIVASPGKFRNDWFDRCICSVDDH